MPLDLNPCCSIGRKAAVLIALMAMLIACSESGSSSSSANNNTSPNLISGPPDPRLPAPARQLHQTLQQTPSPAVATALGQDMDAIETEADALRQSLASQGHSLTPAATAPASDNSGLAATQERLNALRNSVAEQDTTNKTP